MSEPVNLLIAVLGGGGLAGIINGVVGPLIKRPVLSAKAKRDQVDAAMDMVDQLQEEVKNAREATREMTADARAGQLTIQNLGTEVIALRGQVSAVKGQIETFIGWVHEVDMTIERLRFRLPMPVGVNGTPDQKGKAHD